MIMLVFLGLLGVGEQLRHNTLLGAIPVRIHVNGTRGKSTTTRLIAAGLRAAGYRVVAKTTGSAARLILEDGTEVPIDRGRRVGIREQLRVVRAAARRGAEVLVVECMALQPENQWVAEHKMIKATIGVITNVRPDHSEEMGPELADVAHALAATIPERGYLVTGGEQVFSCWRTVARRRGTIICRAAIDEGLVSQAVNLPRPEFTANLACAVKVCELLGVPRRTALDGMAKYFPDPGAVRVYRLKLPERLIYFVNAFAANDLTSTVLVWRECARRYRLDGLPVLGVMNNRRDRPARLRDLVPVVQEIPMARLVFTGQLGPLARRFFCRAGFPPEQLSDLTRLPLHSLSQRILAELTGDLVIFGFGNIKGAGWELTNYFAAHGEECR